MGPTAATPEALAGMGTPPGRAAAAGGPPFATAPPPQGLPEAEQKMEQVNSRQQTGPSPTDKYWAHLLASLPPTASVGQPATEVREAAADQPALDAVPPAPPPPTDPPPPPPHPKTPTPQYPHPGTDLNRAGNGLP